MTLYGFLAIFKSVLGDAKTDIRSSFSCPVSHFFRNFEESFIVLHGFLKISKTVIDVAKITKRSSFSCPVSHFFRNFEVSFMVLYGFLEISKSVIGDARLTYALPSQALSYSFFEILRCRSRYSAAFWKSPSLS